VSSVVIDGGVDNDDVSDSVFQCYVLCFVLNAFLMERDKQWLFSHGVYCRNGFAPIHWAARKGHASCIECLVALGVDVDFRDR